MLRFVFCASAMRTEPLILFEPIPPPTLIKLDCPKDSRAHFTSQDYAPIVPMGAFLPTIDEGDQAVLPESPRKLLQTMVRIPIIVGICDKESFMGFCRKISTSITLEG